MFLFSFLFLSRAEETTKLYGTWGDSYIEDETLLFFEFLRPDLTVHVQHLLQDETDLTKDKVLRLLNQEWMPKSVLGLLNLSLSWRYFHPRASAGRSKENTISELRGYGFSVPNDFNENKIKNFSARFLSRLYSFPNAQDRFSFLRNSAANFPGEYPFLENHPIFDSLIDSFKNLTSNTSFAETISINGRVVDGTSHDVLRALLEETQTKFILSHLQFTNSTDYEQIIYSPTVKEVYNYVSPPHWHRDLTHHDFFNVLQRSPKELNVNATSPEEFMRYKEVLSSIQLFVNINNPMSKYLLYDLLELARSEIPYVVNVYCLGDLTNETEKKIVYSYLKTEETLGARTAIKYLFDALESGNIKKEYKATRPIINWNDIEKRLYNDTGFTAIVNDLNDYYQKVGINDTTYSVNGNFVSGPLSYLEWRRFYLQQVNRLMDAAKQGTFVTNQSLTDYLKNNSIVLEKMRPPIKIRNEQIITFSGIDSRTIISIFENLFNRPSYRHRQAEMPIPVFFVDCKANLSYASVKEDVPNFEFYEIESGEIDPELRLLLRIGSSPKTIIGPHIFEGNLNGEQFDYALRYVQKRYCHNITNKATSPQVFYITILRASQFLNGIKRTKFVNPETNLYIIDYSNPNAEMAYSLITNPFSINFREIIEVASHVGQSGAGIVAFIPSCSTEGLDTTFPFMQENYFPVMNELQNAPPVANLTFVGHKSWAVIRRGLHFYIEGLILTGFAPGANVIKIGDIYHTALKESGYFQFTLPPGIYNAQGLRQSVISDSILPVYKFYMSDFSHIDVPTSEGVHIFSIITNPVFETNFILMLSSLVNTTKEKITAYVVNPPRSGEGFGVNIVPVAEYVPPFLEMSTAHEMMVATMKHAMVDFILPSTVKRVVFVDQSIFFKKDIKLLTDFNMRDAAIAAPHFGRKFKPFVSMWFMERESLLQRAGRPYHSSRFFMIDMENARKQNYFDLFRYLVMFRIRYSIFVNNYDDEIMNQLQVPVQFVTLPEEVSYMEGSTNKKKKDDALTEFVYDPPTKKALFNSLNTYLKLRANVYRMYVTQNATVK
ncbi:hypothetical protein TVAG_277130 [Trichomonas vaginalis G3]|uniref:Glucosyltransferase 24 catalytic domain-containing protein n=1 Tax=Trichomonas vaginalis (strain ATCC PRA-98 / G3) TaxID=412133 RepID=A2FP73_TRIV3|nr:UDP-glucose:glycoprotein glucosyltransferase protein [Trichomonas vaginalis G3]EAX93308.1 hypothetical protein TVAG_277130 [Trichomonas vaginalis G3]KAI5547480.1 UDP-glucose:glycoprotein glucosyltransferase protein [Trichomonas vaginalis G3]|eukprot:XP_001306238.1 hypothetical protein [Trichomonas vaginalis G3]